MKARQTLCSVGVELAAERCCGWWHYQPILLSLTPRCVPVSSRRATHWRSVWACDEGGIEYLLRVCTCVCEWKNRERGVWAGPPCLTDHRKGPNPRKMKHWLGGEKARRGDGGRINFLLHKLLQLWSSTALFWKWNALKYLLSSSQLGSCGLTWPSRGDYSLTSSSVVSPRCSYAEGWRDGAQSVVGGRQGGTGATIRCCTSLGFSRNIQS